MAYKFDEIIQKLGPAGVKSQFQSVGGKIESEATGAHGFIDVYSIYKPDNKASARLNLNTGIYVDFSMPGSGPDKPFAKALCHWLGERGPYMDWKHAYQELCKQFGIENGDGSRGKKSRDRGELVASYDYVDESGRLIYQVCKYVNKEGKKDFRQRRMTDAGLVWGMEGVERIPYRLPEILAADSIFLPEGEKDCDSLFRLGLTATTNPGGAGKWFTSNINDKYFQGKNVIILPDNDPVGQTHAEFVARALHAVAAGVKIINLPGLPSKGDVSDWLANGGTKEKLLQISEATPAWDPPVNAKSLPEVNTKEIMVYGYHLTDVGNGRRLIDLFGQDLHYCYPRKSWFIYDGKRWQVDNTGKIDFLAKKTVISMFDQAIKIDDRDHRDDLLKWAKKSEADNQRKAMITSAKSEEGIPILPEHFDANLWLLNVNNGTLDLRTGEFLPYSREDKITKLAPVDYDPLAECPTWENFIYEIFAADPDLVYFVQQTIGYALTGSTDEQCMFVFWGSGQNGKSTFINAIKEILGDYALETPVETLLDKKQAGGVTNDLARLKGPRFVSAREVDQGRRLAESLVKSLTGQDEVSARYLYGEYFDFKPQFKLFLSTNHLPVIRGSDDGIWRRIRPIRFTVKISDDKKDSQLPNKLRAEYPGILNWALRGCQLWQEDGSLDIPEAVKNTAMIYRSEMDILGRFLEECCVISPGAKVKNKDLYAAYQKWSETGGEKYPLTQVAFGRQLKERDFVIKRSTGGLRIWHDLGLIYESDE